MLILSRYKILKIIKVRIYTSTEMYTYLQIIYELKGAVHYCSNWRMNWYCLISSNDSEVAITAAALTNCDLVSLPMMTASQWHSSLSLLFTEGRTRRWISFRNAKWLSFGSVKSINAPSLKKNYFYQNIQSSQNSMQHCIKLQETHLVIL